MFEEQRRLYETRVIRFLKRLDGLIYEDEQHLKAEYCRFKSPVSFSDRMNQKYREIRPGTKWGRDWDPAWFHITGRIPEAWKGKSVAARINLGSEGLIFDRSGVPLQALSVHSLWAAESFKRDRLMITDKSSGNESVDLWIEAFASQLFGLSLHLDKGDTIPETFGSYEAEFREAVTGIFRTDIWKLSMECALLNSQMLALPEKSVRRKRILKALTDCIDRFEPSSQKVADARGRLASVLNDKAAASDLSTAAVGHAHLDTAWLWPIEESVRKCARTFSTQLRLLERYDNYVFGASQAQHYAFVKEHYPGLFDQIKGAVKQGNWELQGGMWVEADCNLISGESFVRQILYGKRFFKEEFGIDVRHIWLPDVFGYSAALPQIFQKSGCTAFVTQKLSWNQFTQFPHHTFRWRGIDGSEVVAHFPPEGTYNSDLSPGAIIRAREHFKESGFLSEFLTCFGIGDGGGGPTEEMIESGLYQKNLEGAPRVKIEPAQGFLDRLEKRGKELPVWSGELYMEGHRGTLTTHGYNKIMNRQMEQKLRMVETLSALLPARAYPSEAIEKLWKSVLLYQFHDIIPGSSITPVYEKSRQHYSEISREADELLNEAASHLFASAKNHLVVYNPHSAVFNRPVELPESWRHHEVLDMSGHAKQVQHDGESPLASISIPPHQAVTVRRGKRIEPSMNPVLSRELVLENRSVRYRFSRQGRLIETVDRETGRKYMDRSMEGNVFKLFEDRPVEYDAWDVDIFYEKQLFEIAELKSWERCCSGALQEGLRFEFRIGKSRIIQTVILAANTKRLDFHTFVDWKEDHRLLRVYFEVDVQAEEAAYDIQFGNVKRPTHRNRAHDMARFESVGHRYADLSEPTHGAALLSNAKYGYQVLGNALSLSLLRAPTLPDPKADRGEHRFTYSLLPHSGGFVDSRVIEESLCTDGITRFKDRSAAHFDVPFRVEGDIVLAAVKKAEHDDGMIMRFYEPKGKRTRATVHFLRPSESVIETDLMENKTGTLKINGSSVRLDFGRFEIKTIKVSSYLPKV